MSRRPVSRKAGEHRTGDESAGEERSGWVRRLSGYMLRHRRDVVLSLSAALLGSGFQTVVPLVERQIVDGVILQHTSALWPWLALLIALTSAAFGCAYIRRYRGGRVALAVQYDLRNDMHDHLQSMDFDNLNRMPTGQLVARAEFGLDAGAGIAQFLPDHERQHLADAAVARRHDLPVAVAGDREHRGRTRSAGRVVPHALAGLPGNLGCSASARATSPRSSTRT